MSYNRLCPWSVSCSRGIFSPTASWTKTSFFPCKRGFKCQIVTPDAMDGAPAGLRVVEDSPVANHVFGSHKFYKSACLPVKPPSEDANVHSMKNLSLAREESRPERLWAEAVSNSEWFRLWRSCVQTIAWRVYPRESPSIRMASYLSILPRVFFIVDYLFFLLRASPLPRPPHLACRFTAII